MRRRGRTYEVAQAPRPEPPRLPPRPDCECGDAWFVHASQGDPDLKISRSYAGDCAVCPRNGRHCGWFKAVVTPVPETAERTVPAGDPFDDPDMAPIDNPELEEPVPVDPY